MGKCLHKTSASHYRKHLETRLESYNPKFFLNTLDQKQCYQWPLIPPFPVKATPTPLHSSCKYWYTMVTQRCDKIWNAKLYFTHSLSLLTHSLLTQNSLRKKRGRLPVITVWLALLHGPAASFAVLLWGFWAFLVVVVLQLKLSPSFGWQRRWGRHG